MREFNQNILYNQFAEQLAGLLGGTLDEVSHATAGARLYRCICETSGNDEDQHLKIAKITIMTISGITESLQKKNGKTVRTPSLIKVISSLGWAVQKVHAHYKKTLEYSATDHFKLGAFLLGKACHVSFGGEYFLKIQERVVIKDSEITSRGYYVKQCIPVFSQLIREENHSVVDSFPDWGAPDEAPWSAHSIQRRYDASSIHRSDALLRPNKDQMPPPQSVLRAVDCLEKTRWKFNEKICSAMHKVLNSSDREMRYRFFPGIDRNEDAEPRFEKLQQTLQLALEANGESKTPRTFRVKHHLGYRGRIYSDLGKCVCNPQGPDEQRALMLFSDQKRLGKDGLKWLCVHLCHFLNDERQATKGGFLGCVRFVERHKREICSLAEAPLEQVNQKFWASAKKSKRWSFLAACIELERYWKWVETGHDGQEFMSDLPVMIDGTSNAFQHQAALARNEELGVYTNVITDGNAETPEGPRDFYTHVASRASKKLQEKSTFSIDKFPLSDREVISLVKRIRFGLRYKPKCCDGVTICRKLLNTYGLPRTILEKLEIKLREAIQPARTTLSREEVIECVNKAADEAKKSVHEYLVSQFGEKFETDSGYRKFIKNALVAIGFGKRVIPRTNNKDERLRVEGTLRHLVYDSAGEKVDGFIKSMNKLAITARNLGSGLEYQTEDGWIIRVPMDEQVSKRLLISEFEQLPVQRINASSLEIVSDDKIDNAIRICYNTLDSCFFDKPSHERGANLLVHVIHSLDATHLHRTLNSAREHGIHSFHGIHDCIGTHAGDMEMLHQIVIDTFTDLYRENPLRKLIGFYRERIEWMKSRKILRGENAEDVCKLVRKFESSLNKVEGSIPGDGGPWFQEGGPQVSPYLFF